MTQVGAKISTTCENGVTKALADCKGSQVLAWRRAMQIKASTVRFL
jgi:hypothetical protein